MFVVLTILRLEKAMLLNIKHGLGPLELSCVGEAVGCGRPSYIGIARGVDEHCIILNLGGEIMLT